MSGLGLEAILPFRQAMFRIPPHGELLLRSVEDQHPSGWLNARRNPQESLHLRPALKTSDNISASSLFNSINSSIAIYAIFTKHAKVSPFVASHRHLSSVLETLEPISFSRPAHHATCLSYLSTTTASTRNTRHNTNPRGLSRWQRDGHCKRLCEARYSDGLYIEVESGAQARLVEWYATRGVS